MLRSGLLNLLTGVGRQTITKLDLDIQVGFFSKIKNLALLKSKSAKVPVVSIFFLGCLFYYKKCHNRRLKISYPMLALKVTQHNPSLQHIQLAYFFSLLETI